MQPRNRLLELFEPPMSLGDVTRCTVAYIEHHFKDQGIKVIYYCTQLKYSDAVSNQHNAPAGYDTNWGGQTNGTPTGYAGWQGKIWIGLSKPLKRKGISDSPIASLKEIGIYTGKGGGGVTTNIPQFIKDKLVPGTKITDYCKPWSWDIKLFLNDFPSLKMLKLLRPDSPEYRLTFNKDKTVFSHYVNTPWDWENQMPPSRHKAQWLQEEAFYEPLQFKTYDDPMESYTSQPPAGVILPVEK
jgi:hypothetical protein